MSLIRRFAGGLVALCLVVCAASPLPAQADGEKKERKKLSDDDIKKLEKPFLEAMEYSTSGGPAVLADQLKKLGHGDQEGNVDAAVLADVEGWQKLLGRYYIETLGKKPSGTGRIKTERIEINRGGEYLVLEYSYIVPKKYNHDQAWPLVLCFHDKMDKGDGKGYLKDVWLDDRAAMELAEDYILVAPHIGEKSLGGKVKEASGREQAKQFRFEWFTTEHALAMIKPLIEVRNNFNVDPTRIYVSGTGEGAEIAVQLGALYGVETFAAVVARHGQPRDLKYIDGLKDVPTLFLYREGGDYDQGDKKAYWEKIKGAAAAAEIETVTVEAMPALEKLQRKHLAGQATDPLLDAQSRVVEFFKDKVAPIYPTSLRMVTDNRAFVQKSFVKLSKLDLKPGKFIDCSVDVDREKNVINVKGKDFYGLTFFLNDEIVDLDRPVEVVVNDERVQRMQVQRSLSKMLPLMRYPFVGRVWTAVLTAEVVEKAEEKKDEKPVEEEEKNEGAVDDSGK